MLAAGQTLERYVVEDYVGHGGMAVVYRVRHADLGTPHALKLLVNARPGVRDRLLKEGRAQATLRHPNLVGVTDVLRVGGTLALVMEYVDGPDLGQWLAHFGPATADEARALIRDIAAGLAEAHARDITHRDLKPANVLLERVGEGLRAKVTDFGIAKLLEEGSLSSTRSNVAMGTPHYMAPEQIRDAASVDARADVFALGTLLYELATGALAFPGDDVLTVMNAVVDGHHRPPREHDPSLPDDLVAVIEGCLVADRDARIQRCDEVLELLDAVPAARTIRGAALDRTDWEDELIRAAREEWMRTGPPATRRDLADDDEITARLPAPQAPSTPPDAIAPSTPRDSVPTAPRPPDRSAVGRPASGRSAAVVVVRRVVLAAILGIVLGLSTFLALVWLLGGPPGQVVYEAPPPSAGLDQVVDPDAPPP